MTPDSIFQYDYLPHDQMQDELDRMPFPDPPIVHLPTFDDIDQIRKAFQKQAPANIDILRAYQRLARSAASSDIVCGQMVSGHRCGGLVDVEVSVFGAYYQCRRDPSHRFPV